MTSLAIEDAIKCLDAVELLRKFSEAMGFVTRVYLSVRAVEERRPKLETSAGEEIRRLRDERQARLSRLKQYREKAN